jgi:hypothetical protein
MRKISEQAADALIFGYSFNKSNTRVNLVVGGTRMYLHNNLIAEKINGTVRITNSGWFSNTTKDRLNALPNVSISQSKGVWYLNGNPWDGKLIEITK